MSSEKLQDLFYMVLMAGNFLNSVSALQCTKIVSKIMMSEVARNCFARNITKVYSRNL